MCDGSENRNRKKDLREFWWNLLYFGCRIWEIVYECMVRIGRKFLKVVINVFGNKGWEVWWWCFDIRFVFEGNLCDKVW